MAFEFDHFTLCLTRNLEQAYATYRQRFPDHRLYTFGPYTSGEMSYFLPTASSDRGLIEVVRNYQAKPRYSQMSEEDLALRLKWSTCDSPLHEAFEFDAELQDAAERLGLHLDDAFEREDEADVEEDLFASAVADAQAAVCQALRVLDDKGVFGRGEARPLLNLWFGDQSDDAFVQLASTLNPPDVVQRFQAELVQRATLFGDERA
jgi:hypothetical protein